MFNVVGIPVEFATYNPVAWKRFDAISDCNIKRVFSNEKRVKTILKWVKYQKRDITEALAKVGVTITYSVETEEDYSDESKVVTKHYAEINPAVNIFAPTKLPVVLINPLEVILVSVPTEVIFGCAFVVTVPAVTALVTLPETLAP